MSVTASLAVMDTSTVDTTDTTEATDTTDTTDTGVAAATGTDASGQELLEVELLVEEISIDGMCGVY
jgi:mycofactocin precursor